MMHDRRMLCLSQILYQLVRCLRGLTVVLVWRDLSKDAESYIRAPQVPALRAPAGHRDGLVKTRTWVAIYSRRFGVSGACRPTR